MIFLLELNLLRQFTHYNLKVCTYTSLFTNPPHLFFATPTNTAHTVLKQITKILGFNCCESLKTEPTKIFTQDDFIHVGCSDVLYSYKDKSNKMWWWPLSFLVVCCLSINNHQTLLWTDKPNAAPYVRLAALAFNPSDKIGCCYYCCYFCYKPRRWIIWFCFLSSAKYVMSEPASEWVNHVWCRVLLCFVIFWRICLCVGSRGNDFVFISLDLFCVHIDLRCWDELGSFYFWKENKFYCLTAIKMLMIMVLVVVVVVVLFPIGSRYRWSCCYFLAFSAKRSTSSPTIMVIVLLLGYLMIYNFGTAYTNE